MSRAQPAEPEMPCPTKGQNTALEPIFGLQLASPIFRVPNGTIASHIISDSPTKSLEAV